VNPATNCVLYTPAPNYNGPDTICVRVCDQTNLCAEVEVPITVTPVNDAPIANDDTFTTPEDTPLANTVITNDTDVDGPAVLITLVTDVTNGTLVLNPDGTFTYTPDPNYNGPDSFVYSYCDQGTPNLCDQATVSITVTPVNDPPTISQPPVTTPEDTPVTFCPTIADPDAGAILTVSICDAPDFGTAVVNPATNCVLYTPAPNYNGPDTICVRVCDQTNLCAEVEVPITVTPVNDAPVAVDDTFTTTEGQPLTGDVSVNDSDVDGPNEIFNLVPGSGPDNGILVLNPDGTFSYTPNPNFVGTDEFTYSYCDGGVPNLCDTAVVTLIVEGGFVRLTARVFLQGAFLGTNGTLMRDDLRVQGLLPQSTPYPALGNYVNVNNNTVETVSPGVFGNFGNNSIVDWVFVQLRDGNNISNIVATRSALVQRDGDIVDMDGVSPVLFNNTPNGNYFVSVRHRNHLGTATAQPFTLGSTPVMVDFTLLTTLLFNQIPAYNTLEQAVVGNRYALWLGNTDGNDRTIYSGQFTDRDPIFNTVDQAPANVLKSQAFVAPGYFMSDVNMDGRTIFAGQFNDIDPIFNMIDGHPVNSVFRLQSFNAIEQLPNKNP